MTEYKVKNAIVRIHGQPDLEKFKSETTKFLKKVEANKKKEKAK